MITIILSAHAAARSSAPLPGTASRLPPARAIAEPRFQPRAPRKGTILRNLPRRVPHVHDHRWIPPRRRPPLQHAARHRGESPHHTGGTGEAAVNSANSGSTSSWLTSVIAARPPFRATGMLLQTVSPPPPAARPQGETIDDLTVAR